MKMPWIVQTVLLLASSSLAATPDQWRQRTIYQVLTDRFNRPDGSTNDCGNYQDYCGGTFQGLIKRLDYIQGMGFDAIWISPIIENTDGGYHGYWAKNLTNVNPRFGSEGDLKQLSRELHKRGMYLMIDVVGNHMGNAPNGGWDFSQFWPFNRKEHYHDCNGCPNGCNIQDWKNQQQVEHCRLAGLPDLNQDGNSWVRQQLKDWIKNYVVQNFNTDGIRIDTIPEVHPDFWSEFVQSAGVYAVGENFNGDPAYVGPYQDHLPGMLAYPTYYKIRDVFMSKYGMQELDAVPNQIWPKFKDPDLLGVFTDNHDNSRFLHSRNDKKAYLAAIAYSLFSRGIPIVYYGSEQFYSGGNDPGCREPLWTSGFNTQSEGYKFIQAVVAAKQSAQIGGEEQKTVLSQNNVYAFTRGSKALVALTNAGAGNGKITGYAHNLPWGDGTVLCNIFYPTQDCVTYSNGGVPIDLNGGESKVFLPKDAIPAFMERLQLLTKLSGASQRQFRPKMRGHSRLNTTHSDSAES